MLIKKKSILDGIERSMELDITEDQLARWKGGELIQNVFRQLAPDEREFLMTGITPEQWEDIYGGYDDDEISRRGQGQ